MYRKSTVIVVLFVVFSLSVSSIFFTQIYLNNFKISCQGIIASFLGVDKVEYSYIAGNFINGFNILDLSINSTEYSYKSKDTYIDINLAHIFNSQKKINHIALNNSELILNSMSFSGGSNSRLVKKIEIKNIEISYRGNKFFLKKADISEKAKDNSRYLLKSKDANIYLWGYDFDVPDLDLEIFKDYFKYSAKIDNFNSTAIIFKNLNLYGQGRTIMDFTTKFEGINTKILEKDFSDLIGSITYLNNVFSVSLHNIDQEKMKDYSLSGTVDIQDTVVTVNKIDLKMKNNESVSIEDKTFFIDKNSWYGEDIKLKYKNGALFIKDFKIESFDEYFFDLQFNKFDIDLFKGLKANGYLSGELNISTNQGANSAVFSNAKIEDFSYKDYSFDSVKIEGAFNNNELELSDLKLSKQIGFLDVSGSFSSLDNFYNKIIHKLKLKIKL